MSDVEQKEETQEPNYEQLASSDGWVPQEQWKGPADRWVDAKTFVERGAQILPIVQAKNRKLVETVDSLKATVEELKEGNRLFREFHEQTLSKEQKAREKAIADLEAVRSKAISEGDGETFTRTDKQIREMQSQPPPKKEVEVPQDSPAVKAWKAENPWYESDPVLQGITDGLSDVLHRENPALKGKAFLDALAERVKAEVPHKFTNPRRETTVTESHERKSPAKKGKTFEALPAEAQAACDRFVRTIPGFTKEQYLQTYDWSE